MQMNQPCESGAGVATHRTGPSRRAAILLLLAILGLAAWLRFDGLDKWGLWIDEGYTAWLAEKPVAVYAEQMRSDTGPPLFYLLTRPIARMAPRSVFALRLLPAVFGVLAVLFIYWLAVELFDNRWSGLMAATLLAVNTHHILRSQEARNYSLYLALSIAMMICLARLSRRPIADSMLRRLALWVGAVLAGAGMAYTHNIAWFCLAGLLLFYAVACQIRERGRGVLGIMSPLRDAVIAGLAIFLLFLPWLPTFLFQSRHVMRSFWLVPLTITRFLMNMASLVWMPAIGPADHRAWLIGCWVLGSLTMLGIWLAAVIGMIKWVQHGSDQRVTALAACLVLAMLGVAGVGLFGSQAVFMEKTVIFMLAALLLAASATPPLIAQMPVGPWRRRAILSTIILLLVSGTSALAHHGMEFGEEWREATRFVIDQAEPAHDIILIQDEFALMTVAWYVHDTPYGPVDWSRADNTVLVHRDDPVRNLPAVTGFAGPLVLQRLRQVVHPGQRVWAIHRSYDPRSYEAMEQFLNSLADESLPARNYGIIRVREFYIRGRE
jgi:hypothetical protein